MAAPARFPLAVTLPAEVLERPIAPRFVFPFRLLLLLGILPVLLAASMLAAYRHEQSDRIYPGVRVYGLDLSRLTREQATAALKRHVSDLGRQRFELRFDDESIAVTLSTMGFVVDEASLGAWVDEAWSVGRDNDVRAWVRDQVALLRHGFDVRVSAQFDAERAAAVLGRVAPDVERVTVDADIAVQRAGDRFEIHTTPSQTGRRIDVATTLGGLQKSMVGSIPDHVDLALVQAPPKISDADIEPARAAIETLLGSPVVFRDGARTWRLEPAAAFEMLEITGLKEGALPISARLSEDKLAKFVEQTARAADDPAVNPFFAIEGGEVVVKPGREGRLADAVRTLELTRERLLEPGDRVIDIAFKEDKPWLQPADLESARLLANAVLDLPITLETPALPGIPEKKWTLNRQQLLGMLVLPSTRNAPRDFSSLPPAQRPRFEPVLDSGVFASFVGREIAPWVSEDPADAALELKTTRVEVQPPAVVGPVAPVPAATTVPFGTPGATAAPSATGTPVFENRYRVELRNARDGRGPDYDGTFASAQSLFRQGSALVAGPPPPFIATPAPIRPSPVAGGPTATPLAVVTPSALNSEELARLTEERRVTIRLAPRRPRVFDLDLAPAQDQANVLIGEPVTVRWQSLSWTVTRDELVGMLRYQTDRTGKLSAYLSRDGLIAKAAQIAREVERSPLAPRSSQGEVLPLDVPSTAAVIWQLASSPGGPRADEIVWTEEEPATAPTEPPLPGSL